jgi:hypothetical protein
MCDANIGVPGSAALIDVSPTPESSRAAGLGVSYHTHFKIKTKCSSYECSGSSGHTYGQNVNAENQYLYNINFVTRDIVFTRRLG